MKVYLAKGTPGVIEIDRNALTANNWEQVRWPQIRRRFLFEGTELQKVLAFVCQLTNKLEAKPCKASESSPARRQHNAYRPDAKFVPKTHEVAKNHWALPPVLGQQNQCEIGPIFFHLKATPTGKTTINPY